MIGGSTSAFILKIRWPGRPLSCDVDFPLDQPLEALAQIYWRDQQLAIVALREYPVR